MENHKGQQILKGHKNVVYGLGDLTKKFFCRMGKQTDEVLRSMGSERIYELGTGSDDQNNIREHFEKWKINLWSALSGNIPENPEYIPNSGFAVQGDGGSLRFNVAILGEEEEETNIDSLNADEYELETRVKILINLNRNSLKANMRR